MPPSAVIRAPSFHGKDSSLLDLDGEYVVVTEHHGGGDLLPHQAIAEVARRALALRAAHQEPAAGRDPASLGFALLVQDFFEWEPQKTQDGSARRLEELAVAPGPDFRGAAVIENFGFPDVFDAVANFGNRGARLPSQHDQLRQRDGDRLRRQLRLGDRPALGDGLGREHRLDQLWSYCFFIHIIQQTSFTQIRFNSNTQFFRKLI